VPELPESREVREGARAEEPAEESAEEETGESRAVDSGHAPHGIHDGGGVVELLPAAGAAVELLEEEGVAFTCACFTAARAMPDSDTRRPEGAGPSGPALAGLDASGASMLFCGGRPLGGLGGHANARGQGRGSGTRGRGEGQRPRGRGQGQRRRGGSAGVRGQRLWSSWVGEGKTGGTGTGVVA